MPVKALTLETSTSSVTEVLPRDNRLVVGAQSELNRMYFDTVVTESFWSLAMPPLVANHPTFTKRLPHILAMLPKVLMHYLSEDFSIDIPSNDTNSVQPINLVKTDLHTHAQHDELHGEYVGAPPFVVDETAQSRVRHIHLDCHNRCYSLPRHLHRCRWDDRVRICV